MKTHSIRIPIPINGRDGKTERVDLSDVASLLISGTLEEQRLENRQDYLLVPDVKTYAPIQRLVVIVPAGELDERRLGLETGKIAIPGRTSILFLALASDPEGDSTLRRRLVALTSFVGDWRIRTSTRLAFCENWTQAVREVWREGDLLVCIESHRTPALFFRRREIGPYLVSALGVPVCVLTDIPVGKEARAWGRWREVMIWVSAIGVMILFGFLQAFIEKATQDPMSTSLLILSVVVEVLVLWKLNLSG
jgi:hypothetical protein